MTDTASRQTTRTTTAPSRVVVENMEPYIDGGRFAAKAIVG